MKKIFKYPLHVTDHQAVPMPFNANIVSAGLDAYGQLCVWAIVETTAESKPVHIRIVGTGNPMPEVPMLFIDTVVMGSFVWHVFEEIK
jgi:hypothetical protein